jgi:hypothetical protein
VITARLDSQKKIAPNASPSRQRKQKFCSVVAGKKGSLSSFTCVRNADTNSVAANKEAIHQKENHLSIRILQSSAFDRSFYFSDWPLFGAVSPG